nr:MAG TPA: Retinal tissue protein [Caudoviricetes sp.]
MEFYCQYIGLIVLLCEKGKEWSNMKITDEELEMIEKLRSLSPDGLEKALNKLVELAKEQGEDLKQKQTKGT